MNQAFRKLRPIDLFDRGVYTASMKFFLPRQPEFYDLFHKLNAAITKVAQVFAECAREFTHFEQFHIRARTIEQRADDVTHTIVDRLNKTFITPFDREDIYALAQEMDDVVDLTEAALQRLFIYQPGTKRACVDDFSRVITQAVGELNKLLTECFKHQKHTPEIAAIIVRIHELEDEGDQFFQLALKQLFAEEKDTLTLLKWKDIIENLEDITDKFQSVCDTLESMVVKFS